MARYGCACTVCGRQEAELGFGPLEQCSPPSPRESGTVYRSPWARRTGRVTGLRSPPCSGTARDSSAPGLLSSTPPAHPFFFPGEQGRGNDYFLLSTELTVSAKAAFGSFSSAPSSHFSLLGPQPWSGCFMVLTEGWGPGFPFMRNTGVLPAALVHWPDTHNFLCLQGHGPPSTPCLPHPALCPGSGWLCWGEGCADRVQVPPHRSPV